MTGGFGLLPSLFIAARNRTARNILGLIRGLCASNEHMATQACRGPSILFISLPFHLSCISCKQQVGWWETNRGGPSLPFAVQHPLWLSTQLQGFPKNGLSTPKRVPLPGAPYRTVHLGAHPNSLLLAAPWRFGHEPGTRRNCGFSDSRHSHGEETLDSQQVRFNPGISRKNRGNARSYPVTLPESWPAGAQHFPLFTKPADSFHVERDIPFSKGVGSTLETTAVVFSFFPRLGSHLSRLFHLVNLKKGIRP